MYTYRLNVAVFGAIFLFQDTGFAQVVTDGTAGPGEVLSGPDYEIGADLGTQAGDNLFHSFDQFSIDTGESATFSGPGTIDNVISRVTGGDISSIDGRLASSIPGASLWLFNPAGVVFGPNASLDVSGSFHVSTADELRTADGGRFSAVEPENGGFSVAAPESFGFLGADPAGIGVAGSQLAVNDGETLSVTGGDVDIVGGSQLASGGNLNILAASGPGEADPATGELSGAEDGDINVQQSVVATVGDGGGTVRIEGGALVVDEASTIVSANTGTADGDVGIDIDVEAVEIKSRSLVTTRALADGKGGAVDIEAADLQVTDSTIATEAEGAGDGGDVNFRVDKIVFRDGRTVSLTGADGDGGDISVVAGDLELATGAITTSTLDQASGDGGNITVTANDIELLAEGPDSISLVGTGSFGSGNAGDIDVQGGRVVVDGNDEPGGVSIQTLPIGPGSRGGQIRLVADSLELLRGGSLFADSSGTPDGSASIEVTANRINIDRGEGIDTTLTGIALDGKSGGTTSGAIIVRAGELDINNGGQITSVTANANDSSDIVITADRLSLNGLNSQISARSSEFATGNAGRITIDAGAIDLNDDGRITSSTFSEGNAGVIEINANESIQLLDQSQISTSALPGSTGDAGSIVIDTPELNVVDAGAIISTTDGGGDAGSIAVTADKAVLDARNGDQFGGIATQSLVESSGNAGDIDLVIGDLTILNTTAISSTSFGSSDGGTISIRSNDITIDALNADPAFLTGITTSASSTDGFGDGGAIVIVADRLVLSGDTAQIVSANNGFGAAGTIDIQLTESLAIDGGGDINTTSVSGGGGGITITAGDFITVTGPDGAIATSVADDSGNAGDIVITTPVLALGDANVVARADAGRGGDIQINADDLVVSPDALITAEAGATGVDGTVVISSPEEDLNGGLAALDSQFLDISALLRERCAARNEADSSSFTLGTGGAIPPDPDAPRPSLLRALPEGSSSHRQGQRTVLVVPCPKAAS